MKKYRIGETSKLLGMTNDTLRFYESKGIIVPQRDEESGYRYYDSWDMNLLLDSLWFRSYGFSIAEVTEMINNDTLDDYIEKCSKQEIRLLHKIKEMKHKLRNLSEYSEELKELRDNIGIFKMKNSPELFFQERMSITNEEEVRSDSENIISEWTKHMPEINHTFIAILSDIDEDTNIKNLIWGFSLPMQEALNQKMETLPKVQYLAPKKCIETIFQAGERGSFAECLIDQVIKPIKEMSYRVEKPPLGKLIVKIHENDELIRYFKVWVPIED